ncbi:50S ribosomal protein L11 methyltransferase [Streptomyces sp. NBRC 109706]|uniref:50S ribosomal protein L11 methyltransferase n=1 Tax=Streptomyces sp. NBRC 109706 TaxID=1550035 RepID=UPI0007814AFD|nr:50S ribosomal protein L11 methyltransferase [Streptomyces sp. NBRC 109706]
MKPAPRRTPLAFIAHLDAARRAARLPYEPWLGDASRRGLPVQLPDWVAAAHGVAPASDGGSSGAEALGLDTSRWQLTGFRGLLAVRDRVEGEPGVYLGEDGLRFLDGVLAARPGGRVIEIGSGSGIVAAALARTRARVDCVDIDPLCVTATEVTARLNGVADRVHARRADLLTLAPAVPYDTVVANLPGVPVPDGLRYSAAGDGGPDGLRLIRHLLAVALPWLRPAAEAGPSPRLLMRFQSLGTAAGPLLLAELRDFAARGRLDIEVCADSRVRVAVRNGLTAHYAGPLNPGRSQAELLKTCDDHAAALGMDYYYSATLAAHPGEGTVRFTDTSAPDRLASRHRPGPLPVGQAGDRVTRGYLGKLGDLPDGFWEAGTPEAVELPLTRMSEFAAALADHADGLAAVGEVFADHLAEHPAGGRAVYTTANLLAGALTDAGVLA